MQSKDENRMDVEEVQETGASHNAAVPIWQVTHSSPFDFNKFREDLESLQGNPLNFSSTFASGGFLPPPPIAPSRPDSPEMKAPDSLNVPLPTIAEEETLSVSPRLLHRTRRLLHLSKDQSAQPTQEPGFVASLEGWRATAAANRLAEFSSAAQEGGRHKRVKQISHINDL